jgi:heme exporter protein D
VRGGAIAPFVWSVLLIIMMVINIIWTTGDEIQAATFGFAILMIWLVGLALLRLAPHEALRRGGPERVTEPEALPSASGAAALAGVGLGAFSFGWAFGGFWIFFGAGIMVICLARLALERRAQHAAYRRYLRQAAGDQDREERRV